MYSVSEREPMNPWLSMWAKPRETMRWILDTDPTRHIHWLVMIIGFSGTLARASSRDAGDVFSIPIIFLLALTVGSLSGLIGLYIGGAILRWSGSLLGGQATSEEVRAAIAWSSVPTIWALILWIPELILFREELFQSYMPRIAADPILRYLFYGFGIVEIVIAIWSYIVYLKCLGEAHRFSVWKAFGATIIPGLILLVIVFACVFSLQGF